MTGNKENEESNDDETIKVGWGNNLEGVPSIGVSEDILKTDNKDYRS